MAKPARPTDAELEIVTVLWSRGPSTVRDVHDTITRRRPACYTTIRRDQKQRAHIYAPLSRAK